MIEALEVFPVPPSVEVTWTLLFFTPAVVPCTLTETVQEALAAKVPAERLIAARARNRSRRSSAGVI